MSGGTGKKVDLWTGQSSVVWCGEVIWGLMKNSSALVIWVSWPISWQCRKVCLGWNYQDTWPKTGFDQILQPCFNFFPPYLDFVFVLLNQIKEYKLFSHLLTALTPSCQKEQYKLYGWKTQSLQSVPKPFTEGLASHWTYLSGVNKNIDAWEEVHFLVFFLPVIGHLPL